MSDPMLALIVVVGAWPPGNLFGWWVAKLQYSHIYLPFNWRILVGHPVYVNWVKRKWGNAHE